MKTIRDFADAPAEPAVFHDMSDSFFHGFKPMRFGAFRWISNAACRAS